MCGFFVYFVGRSNRTRHDSLPAYVTAQNIESQYLHHQLFPLSRGAAHTFAWLEEELYALDEVIAFASKRLDGAADVLEQEFFR